MSIRIKLISLITISLALSTIAASSVSAVTAADWRAGRIIDDSTFTDKNSMSVDAIQAFLNSKVPACDTYGQKTSELGGIDYNNDGRTTRREYAQYRGYGENYIFTCLRNYYEIPKTAPGPGVPPNNSGGAPIPAGAKSAAQIIADAAAKYSISPKVLLVKLGTESPGPLTSDDWPLPPQFLYAMGAHCPDSGPNGSANCDSNYASFSLQMEEAAALLRWYLDSMGEDWWQYKKPYQTNHILWNVSQTGCGGGEVYVENMATAALYTYTPYQPNQAALNNMYGKGDGCSAYGNRNFWRTFSDWFGINGYGNTEITISKPIVFEPKSLVVGQPTTISYKVQNRGQTIIDSGVLWVCASQNGKSFGLGSNRKLLEPGEELAIQATYTPPETGIITITACGNTPNGPGWVPGYPYASLYSDRSTSASVTNNGLVISGAIAASDQPSVGAEAMLYYLVQNRGATAIDSGVLRVCVLQNGQAFGVGSSRKVLQPNESLWVAGKYTPKATGTLTISACGNTPNGPGWVPGYPARDYADHGTRSYTVKSSPLVISGAIGSSQTPRVGVKTNLGYVVQNRSNSSVDTGILWVCGALGNSSFGLGSNRRVLGPYESMVVSGDYTPSQTGTLTISACGNTPNGPGWVPGYPARDYADHGTRSYTVAESPIVISGAIAATTSSPRVGEPLTALYIVKNRATVPADTGVLWICAKMNNSIFGLGSNQRILDPGATMLIAANYTPPEAGTLELTACGNTPNGPGWVPGYPARDYADHAYKLLTVTR